MSNPEPLLPGALYVFLTLRTDPGDCHWGLYHHISTTTIPVPSRKVKAETSASPSGTAADAPNSNEAPTSDSAPTLSDAPQPSKTREVHRGTKYHVRNLGPAGAPYTPDHARASDILSTLFLVGLLRVSPPLPDPSQTLLDSTIRSLDERVPELSVGNMVYCRTWVVGVLMRLVGAGVLKLKGVEGGEVGEGEVWRAIEEFGVREWEGASEARMPRPVVASTIFEV